MDQRLDSLLQSSKPRTENNKFFWFVAFWSQPWCPQCYHATTTPSKSSRPGFCFYFGLSSSTELNIGFSFRFSFGFGFVLNFSISFVVYFHFCFPHFFFHTLVSHFFLFCLVTTLSDLPIYQAWLSSYTVSRLCPLNYFILLFL